MSGSNGRTASVKINTMATLYFKAKDQRYKSGISIGLIFIMVYAFEKIEWQVCDVK